MYRLIKLIKILMIFPVLMWGMQAGVGRSQAEDVYQKADFRRRPAQSLSRNNSRNLLTLMECVQLAIKHNPDLSVAVKERDFQKLEKPLTLSDFFPTLDIESSYTRFQEKQRVVPAHRNFELGVFDEDLMDAALVLRLPIFQGGRRIAAYRIAQLAEQGALEELTTTKQDLVLNVASLFYKILQLAEVVRATDASLKALEVQKDTTHLSVEVGRAAPLDAMKVDVRLASLQQLLSRLQADRQVLLFQLARLMGTEKSRTESLELIGVLQAKPESLPLLQEARDVALRQRSEYKNSQVQLEQAKEELALARADYWPQLRSFARYGVQSGIPYSQESPGDAKDNETAWAAGIELDIPLFRGGATRTRVAQAKIRIQQAKERIREVELRINEELQQAFTKLDDSRSRMVVTKKNVDVAQETLRIEQAKYRDGKSTINFVLDAQAAMLRAEVEYSQAVVDYLLSQVGWERALGSDLVASIGSGQAESR